MVRQYHRAAPPLQRRVTLFRCFDKVRVGKAAHGRIAAVRAVGPVSVTLVRPMAVESGRSVPRAGEPRRPGISVTRTNETMMRVVAVFVGREV